MTKTRIVPPKENTEAKKPKKPTLNEKQENLAKIKKRLAKFGKEIVANEPKALFGCIVVVEDKNAKTIEIGHGSGFDIMGAGSIARIRIDDRLKDIDRRTSDEEEPSIMGLVARLLGDKE